jgi:excinuclease ABC subunit B
VNLLREGLDLPEVSLVAIMDADKEGFLRDVRSLIQTIGRAARNERGKVIMYADRVTGSMREAIDETDRRRAIQLEYNVEHGITPKTVFKSREAIMQQTKVADSRREAKPSYYVENDAQTLAADPVVSYMTREELEKQITQTQKSMEKAAKDLDFMQAARLRDELADLKRMLRER